MQAVSDSVKAMVDGYARTVLTVYIGGEKIDARIGSCILSTSCGDDAAFTFGSACASSVDLVFADPLLNIKAKSLVLTWAVDGNENPLFVGKVEDAFISAGKTTVKAWDAMYYSGNDVFNPSEVMRDDVEAAEAFAFVAETMGVAVDPVALALLAGIMITGGFSNVYDEIHNATAAGYLAGLIGGNAVIDRSGRLTIRRLTQIDFETEPYSDGATAQDTELTVSGVTLQKNRMTTVSNEDGTLSEQVILEEYIAGDGLIVVTNPLVSETTAENIYAALSQVTFRPGTYSIPGGLLLEPGDVFPLHTLDGTYNVAAISLIMNIDGGVKTTLTCGRAMPFGGMRGAINQSIASLVTDFAKLKKLVADNAEINSANIHDLKSSTIVAERIKVGILQSRDESGSYFKLNLDTGEMEILSDTIEGTVSTALTGGEILIKSNQTSPGELIVVRGRSESSLIELHNQNAAVRVAATKDNAAVELLVETEGEGACLLKIASTSAGIEVKQRLRLQGVWDDWDWVNSPPLVPGIEYRTAERWKGEPVYSMAVSCGVWSKGSKITVPVESCSQIIDLYGETADGGLLLPGSMKAAITNNGIRLTMCQCHANSGATDLVIKYIKS